MKIDEYSIRTAYGCTHDQSGMSFHQFSVDGLLPDTRTFPLAGIKVLELEGIGPGPLGCCMLADFGAEVNRKGFSSFFKIIIIIPSFFRLSLSSVPTELTPLPYVLAASNKRAVLLRNNTR